MLALKRRGQLSPVVGGLHAAHVGLRGVVVVDDAGGVVDSDHAAGAPLHRRWRLPRLVDERLGVLGQLRDPLRGGRRMSHIRKGGS